MKKIYILITFLIILSGCSNIKSVELKDLTKDILISDINKSNVIRNGYKYYLPQGLRVDNKSDYNEIINYKNYKLYMYVDIVSYYNKIEMPYETNIEPYYSEKLENGDKFGYIEINLKESNKYLIEIMYNYAKIEVIVDESDIKEVVAYSLNILKSITYNDKIIANNLEDNILSYTEEEYDIFESSSNESKYLYYVEEYGNYEEDKVKDNDLIN